MTLKIAVLDDYNNLASQYVSSISETMTVFTDTLPFSPALVERLEPFEVICTMRERTPFRRELLEQLPNLKYLLTTGMKNAAIDLDCCKEKGIIVAGTAAGKPPTGPLPTTQHTFALLLALASNIVRDHNLVTSNSWLSASPLNTSLPGKTVGLVGLGRLGGDMGRLGVMFGMKVIAWSPHLNQDRADELASSFNLPKESFKAVTKSELFSSSDVISIHLVLSDSTRGIIGEEELNSMKSTALLINTSRGPLVDETALLDVLEAGKIRGAALDVFDQEPLPVESRWRTTAWGKEGRSEVILTPHTGYTFEESIHAMWEGTKDNLERIVRGEEVENRMT